MTGASPASSSTTVTNRRSERRASLSCLDEAFAHVGARHDPEVEVVELVDLAELVGVEVLDVRRRGELAKLLDRVDVRLDAGVLGVGEQPLERDLTHRRALAVLEQESQRLDLLQPVVEPRLAPMRPVV